MYQVIIEWHDQFALISEESDFYSDLRNKFPFPLEHKSWEEVDNLIYDILDNLFYNHYGLFSQQTEIKHIIIY